ncbi:hypothetical protein EYZ66_04190 [Aequoribacter fuscus]|uniref:hypothetical protein n=1 Tax=Aequoribacter fuscus TaxID=2518989 RepID=UPI000593DC30|nr:hypothetical protein [Aequoribacter fuscus]QHJ87550.1 hypothetical protein EYZ66_04190 [Aequoribacter fuscus]
MSKRPKPTYARDHCIYLDFEGEGRSKNRGSPPPHLAGVYRPKSFQWGNAHYKATFFKESWSSITRVRGACTYAPSIADFINGLLDEAEQNDQKIVYWSDYERAVVAEQCPEHLERFKANSINLLPTAKRYINRRRMTLNTEDDKVLNQYLRTLKPNAKTVKTPQIGAAESCRRTDAALAVHSRFKRWPLRTKQIFIALLAYNADDCRALFTLSKKLLKTPKTNQAQPEQKPTEDK